MSAERYVATQPVRAAVKGRETEILEALGIAWQDGAPHISCPYPEHTDDNPSWRWDERRARAYCSCIERGDSVFDVVMHLEGIDFEAAKLRVAEILGRHDLIRASGGQRHHAMDAASLLWPPPAQHDGTLVQAYLACRVDVAPESVPMPSTPVAGWRSLAYYDPPPKKGREPHIVGHYPCMGFGTLAPDGRRHAHRIYVAPAGAGKAELGSRSNGRPRDPKKSARLKEGQSAAGCAVLWGEPTAAPHLVLAEGIETAAAVALAHRHELETGELVVAAALSTAGIRSFQPWPKTRQITVAADRDEGSPDDDRGHRAGEKAARDLALAHHEHLEIRISGISSSGKTLAQKLAASVWGPPRIGAGLVQSMRTTENALESLAQASCGTVLALDEVAHVDGRAVGRMIYSIASGIGKARLNAQAALKGRYAWQTFVLFSSECGLEAKIRGDGGTWLAGMAVRIADIDVTGVNRTVAQATLDAITDIERHFGHAGPAFVEGLLRDGYHRNPEDPRRQINRAASLIAREEVGTRVRAATPFAILLVAGELAKALEVVPPAADIRAAVLWAWERYLGSSEAIALDPAEQTVSHLRTWIAERWDVTVKSVDAAWDDVDGRRLNNRETLAWYDADTVYVPATRLREAAGNVLTEREIAQALDQRSLLARRSDARRIAVRRVPNVGRIDAYALRRDQFGRPALGAGPDLQVHEGGLR